MVEKSIARLHHYLPQSYLAAFTCRQKVDQFFVLDVQTGNSFRTSPLNVGAERDFNRVDVEGHPLDAIENALARFEGEAIASVRRVIDTESFPSDSDWNLILNLLGLIAVRNPKLRGSFNQSRERMYKDICDILVSDQKVLDRHVKKAHEAGAGINDTIPLEDVRQFVENENYRIKFHPQGNLHTEFHAFDKLLPLLGQRLWSVLVAPPEGPEFICSDHPVTVVWKDNRSSPVGFGLKETEVFFPLGRCVGFYGVFESPLNEVVRCTPENVARLNQRVVMNAERHVYSSQESFAVWNEGKIQEIRCKDK